MEIRKNIAKNYLFFFLIFFFRLFSFILLLYCSMASLTSISSFAIPDFYKRCMKDALESLGNEVEEEDDDPFMLQIVRK